MLNIIEYIKYSTIEASKHIRRRTWFLIYSPIFGPELDVHLLTNIPVTNEMILRNFCVPLKIEGVCQNAVISLLHRHV